MTDPGPAFLTALRLLTLLLGVVFVLFCYEFWAGMRARRNPRDVWTHHRWEPEILNAKLTWMSCVRCGAVMVRTEP